MSQTPFESPDADAAEQRAELVPDDANATYPIRRDDLGWDVDPTDAAEQSREVPTDEDEWR